MHLLTTDEMGRADRLTVAAGTPGIVLMERAGVAVATEACRMQPRRGRIAIVCGPGNNGGDGFVAARLLQRRGYAVEVGLLGNREALRGDAAEAASRYDGIVADATALRFDPADAVIDALFGAGLARDLQDGGAELVARMNAADKPILAVDVPTGIDGDTGGVRGIAVRATRTVTFFRRKPGHLLLPGRIHCGETIVADIGIDAATLVEIAPRTFVNQPGLWRAAFPAPAVDGHKYERGHAVALSGSLSHTGAARLAAMGALRAGAGLVTVASPSDALLVHAAHLTAIMLTRCDRPEQLAEILADKRKNAVVLGPGLGVGPATRAHVEAALRAEAKPAVVLDADALTSFAGDAAGLAALVAGRSTVVTPHAGEFARLFGGNSDIAQAGSKLEAARLAAKRLGAVVVYKGLDTVVASLDGRAAIGCDLPPWLATAGSGDVLAGMICGLLAQHMPAFEAACCGVWMHGAAARTFGPGLIAEDLPMALPRVVAQLSRPQAPQITQAGCPTRRNLLPHTDCAAAVPI